MTEQFGDGSAGAQLLAPHSQGSPVSERLNELAQALLYLQEDMPSADVRNALGEAAHYLQKFAGLAQPTPTSPVSETLRRKERISMAKEICSHRGENPGAIDRRGIEGWEKYEPLAGACIREAERLFALRSSAHAQKPKETAQDALEQARAYIEHDVETQAPGWRTAQAIIELIDAALTDTSTADHAQCQQEPYAVEYRVERDGHLYSYMHAGKPPEGAQDVRWLYLADTSTDCESAPRVPKVRTSHHRNKEEAARLQKLVNERLASSDSSPEGNSK